MCFFVFGLSYLRIALSVSGRSFSDAVAFVGTGFIAFSFISGAVTSAARSFSSPQGVHATSALPLSTSIFRTVTANVLDFAHEALVVVLLIAAFGVRPSWRWLEVVPAIFLVMLFHFGLLLWLGPLVCRFRDVGPIIGMIQRIAIFLSPIFWSVDQVQTSGRLELAKWNPYTYFISAFRDPILGITHEISALPNPLAISLIIALANFVVGLLVFGYSYPRLTYWATAA
jgi:ABC-type polysaccharide/polyol phosphate export permease